MKQKTKNREGITYYPTPGIRRQLKQLALDLDTSVTDLIGEAVMDLFAKKGTANKNEGDKNKS